MHVMKLIDVLECNVLVELGCTIETRFLIKCKSTLTLVFKPDYVGAYNI